MALQQTISAQRLALKVGREIDVLIDEVDEDGAVGRSAGDAPEIDGCVYVSSDKPLQPGDMVTVPRYDKPGKIVRVDHKRHVAVVSLGLGQWEVPLDEVFPTKPGEPGA